MRLADAVAHRPPVEAAPAGWPAAMTAALIAKEVFERS